MTFPVPAASRICRKPVTARKALLISCASAAIAAAVGAPQKARAQAFNAPTIPQGQNIASTGSATRSFTSGTTETITIGSSKALINWTPDESGTGPTIDFLQAGNVATFQGGVGFSDYTVLNRILPDGSRAISLNGEVRGRLDGGATGGRIWFYSPNGIVVGGGAVFDVGSLLLTTNDPLDFTTSTDGFGRFKANENSLASVEIGAGAQITASPTNSYVALIAPKVVQAGNVRVNGNAAYVGAEDVVMTVNQGLFDIQVGIGTADGSGIVHAGTTGGPSSTGAGDNHRIYMVAVPKNEMLTMVVGGNVGFDEAASASIENGEIILRAGWDTVVTSGGLDAITNPSSIQANLHLRPGNYTSDVSGVVTGDALGIADTGSLNFAGDLSLASYDGTVSAQVHVGAINGNSVDVDGNLWLDSRAAQPISVVSAYAVGGGSLTVGGFVNLYSFDDNGGGLGGLAALYADNGSISITGPTQMAAPGFIIGANSPTPQSAVGGTVNIWAANGGTITTSNLAADASADGQRSFVGGDAGNGTGGNVHINAATGGQITVNGNLTGSASGTGGAFINGSGAGAPGDGRGGSAVVHAETGGDITVIGNVYLTADGIGGNVSNPIDTSAAGGNGYGGEARMATYNDGSTITAGDVFLNVNGHGGDGFSGGAGYGGGQIGFINNEPEQVGSGAGIQGHAGTMSLGDLNFNAVGTGGDASLGFGGSGGYAQGGTTYLEARASLIVEQFSAATINGGNVTMDVNAVGGVGGAGFSDIETETFIAAGAGGNAQGGTYTGANSTGGAHVIADSQGGILNLGDLDLYAVATGGGGGTGGDNQTGGAGGNAYGGTVNAGTFNPNPDNTLALADVDFGDLDLNASALGGTGGAGNSGLGGIQGVGGDAYGGGYCGESGCGGALLSARGTVTLGSATLLAQASGGGGSIGGDGTGGDTTVLVRPDGSMTSTGSISANAVAWGGYGTSGNGGNATGGWSGALVDGGTLSTGTAQLRFDSGGIGGGAGTSNFNGGIGQGGIVDVTVLSGGSIGSGAFDMVADGYGGDGGSSSTGGAGGNGIAGSTSLTIGDGTFAVGVMTVTAWGVGGDGGTGSDGVGSAGGIGIGGSNTLLVDTEATMSVVGCPGCTNTNGGAGGSGSSGAGDGGSAEAGDHTVTFNGSSSQFANNFLATSFAMGGDGATGGNALGGTSQITVNGSLSTGGNLQSSGQAEGGEGFAGTGGNANAGSGEIDANGTLTAGSIFVAASATGGAGTAGGGFANAGTAAFNANSGTAQLTGSSLVQANGTGGSSSGGIGGDGTGGYAQVTASGSLTANNLTVRANGVGEVGVDGGWGIAQQNVEGWGGAAVQALGDGSLALTGATLVEASATGGNGTTGAGGGAVGGFAQIFGATSLGGSATVNATAVGGSGATGNHATGGQAIIERSTINANSLVLNSSATGGAGSAGLGGNALAGAAILELNGVNASVSALTDVRANALGGAGAAGGGVATGGGAVINVADGVTASLGSSTGATAHAVGGNSSGGTGGSAQAGNASITVAAGGQLNAPPVAQLAAGAVGTGGNGVDGGTGTGGTASIDVQGSLTSGGQVLAYASGRGGGATTGTGGFGDGGDAGFDVGPGGTANVAALDVNADAFGGDSAGGFGGDAQAGFALLRTAGNFTATGEVFVSSDGEGGDGLAGGGNGYGSDASVQLSGTAQVTGSLTARAAGTGGSSANGTGGGGYGGYARMSAHQGGVVTANDVTIDSSGDGGDGLNGGDGVGGQNFEASGGSVIQVFDAGSALTLTGSTNVVSNGVGGDATGVEGLGGDGTGGFAHLASYTSLIAGDALIEASGTGGDAGGSATAGSGFGGTAQMTAEAGSIDAAGVTIIANGTAGTGGSVAGTGDGGNAGLYVFDGTLEATNAVLLANGTTEGGEVRVDVNSSELGASLALLSLNATANGGDFAGDVLVDVSAGATADFGNAVLTANGGIPTSGEDGIELDIVGELNATNLTLTASDDIQINTHFGGTINVEDTLEADSIGLITMSDNGYFGPVNATVIDLDGANIVFNATANADDILFTVDGDYAISDLPFASNSLSITAGGDITAAESVFYSTSLLLNAGVDITTFDIFTGNNLSLTAGGNISATDLTAGGSLTLNADGNIGTGDLTASLGVAAGAGGDLTVGDVASGVVISDVVGQAVVASGENVLLSAGGNLTAQTIGSGEAITLDAGGTLTTTDLDAVAAIAATSVGDMLIGNASAGQSIALLGESDITAGDLDAGTAVSVDAAGMFTVGDVSGDTAAFTAGGLANFQGIVGATTITVTSGDINIADGASVGADGITDLITFNAVSEGTAIILGGDGTEAAEGQYQLAEDGDITAGAVVFNAVATEGGSAPDIRVLDAEIDGSQASDGGVAHVTLNTDANVFVEGQVTFGEAAATDTLSINAGETIQVITDAGGGISMTDSSGEVTGILELTAHDVWVADQAMLDQIAAADPNFDGFEELLAVNNGPVNPEGSIQAGGLSVTMLGSSFLVQNTGSDTELAGLTVGPGGLSIANEGTDPPTVIIYGRQIGADGSIITGDGFFEEVVIGGPGGFTDNSNVNGCGVVGGCGPDLPDTPPFGGGVKSILGPIGLMNDPKSAATGDDDFAGSEEEEEEEGEEGEGGTDAGSSLINTGPVSIDTPINQPVTSGSDPTGTN